MTPSKYEIIFKDRGIIVKYKKKSTHIDKSETPEKVSHGLIDAEDCFSSTEEFSKHIARKFEEDLNFEFRMKEFRFREEKKVMALEHGFAFEENKEQ